MRAFPLPSLMFFPLDAAPIHSLLDPLSSFLCFLFPRQTYTSSVQGILGLTTLSRQIGEKMT